MLSLNPEKKQKGQSNDADAHVGPRIRMRRVWLDMTQVALGSAIGVARLVTHEVHPLALRQAAAPASARLDGRRKAAASFIQGSPRSRR